MDENKFPVTNSTLSGKALSKYLQHSYRFTGNTDCRLFRAAMNHLYVVTDGARRYVFRVYTHSWRTKLEISEELRLLNLLKENDASVAYPIPDRFGKLIQEFDAPEGKRFGVLFSYASGEKMPRFSAEASYCIGKALSKMHQATGNTPLARISYDETTLLADSLPRIKELFKGNNEEVAWLDSLSDFLTRRFAGLDNGRLRYGAVHMDVWFDNLHIGENNEVTFFDFDFCGNGWLCLDVSYFLFQLLATHLDEQEYQLKANRFLAGYEEVATISEEERKLLPYGCLAVMVYYIGIQCDRFDYWTNIFVNSDHLKRMVGNLKRWIRVNGIDVH